MAGFGGSACPAGTRTCQVPAGTGKVTGTHAVGTGAFRAGGAIIRGTGASMAMGLAVGRGAIAAEARKGVVQTGFIPRCRGRGTVICPL